MSGEMVARRLHEHFDQVRRAELTRLHKKIAGLSEGDLAEVEAITADIVHALARRPAAALAEDGSPELVRTLVDLFRVA
ncbi:MAG: hypothetical protein AB7O67_09425 [Vicinamibacterales bacterium]